MSIQLLQKVLGRGRRSRGAKEAFTLPGALFDEVRVLLVDSGDLTDLLFAMPLVEEIRERYRDVILGIVAGEPASQVALSSGMFQDVIVFNSEQLNPKSRGFASLSETVGSEPWDVAILLGRDPDAGRESLAESSGAVLRLGAAHESAYPRINCAVRSANGSYPYRRTATLGRLFGMALEHVPLHWPLPEDRMRQMAQLVHFNKPRKDQLLIGVDPGVGKEGTLLAPENLAFLANHLASHIPSKSILLSADPDPERLAAFGGLLRGDMLDLPRPSLTEMVLFLAQCDLFLAGNTDLFHYAVAMGVPTVGIFTEQDGERWIPEGADDFEILMSRQGEKLSLSELMERVQGLLSRGSPARP